MFQEIKELGYKGGITQLRDYLRSIKPVPQAEEVIRFETAPGKQMQVDWIEFGKGKNSLSAFVATLGFSRSSYVEFVSNEKLATLIYKTYAMFGSKYRKDGERSCCCI
jgi:transposase